MKTHTIKHNLSVEKWGVGHLSAFGWAVLLCCFGVQCLDSRHHNNITKLLSLKLISVQHFLLLLIVKLLFVAWKWDLLCKIACCVLSWLNIGFLFLVLFCLVFYPLCVGCRFRTLAVILVSDCLINYRL